MRKSLSTYKLNSTLLHNPQVTEEVTKKKIKYIKLKQNKNIIYQSKFDEDKAVQRNKQYYI